MPKPKYEDIDSFSYDPKREIAELKIGDKTFKLEGIKAISIIGRDFHVNVGVGGSNGEIYDESLCELVDLTGEGKRNAVVCWVGEMKK